jgi:hypothetical protein
MSEKPVRDRPRRLADWLNLAGCKEDPLLGGSGFQVEGFGDLAAEKRRPQSSSPRLGPKAHSQAPRPDRPLGLAGACAPALPESFVAPASRTRFCESWMRENRTSSLSGGRRPALRRASSDPMCAGQRFDPEGSSPSAARMRGGLSKDGGNASSAGERNHGEPYAGTKSETTDTAKGMHLPSRSVRKDNQRAGCPPRGGIRKACGEVPGRNRGEPSP